MKQIFGASQQRSAAVPIGAGVALLGAGIYYKSRSKPQVSDEQARRDRAQAKRDEGLSGAGIGGNAVTGGHELSHVNPQRSEGSTAPLEKLPSGGVGGGVGAGGANVRSIEMTAKQRGGVSPSGASGSAILGSIFGTGATSESGTGDETKDTRVASNYDGTPTRRNATHHDQHQPRVPKSGNAATGDSQGDDDGRSGQSLSQTLQGAFGQGGKRAAEQDDQNADFRNTKIASNHAETPTKRAA
ncbi:hypothetical protein CEP52_006093 [Fusarium oligoseptatum]|uniref:Uncharacterized protein n=1 Tax=Fusarium oligoseptatum TaxID=2604345 RepID=A0A428TUU0_9HYPO|nr:hypothetical protein CEP52_006093 [Fusarium oligoseptatum]